MTTYREVVDAVKNYYGTSSDIWQKVVTSGASGLTPSDLDTLQKVPGVQITVSNDGKFRGWDYENPFPEAPNPAAPSNSNVPNASYGKSSFTGRVNGTYHWDGQTQTGRLTSGARRVSNGTRVATVAGKLNTAITAVSAGMFFGAKIDSALYNIGKFFDLNPPESLNPETWDSIASTELGKSVIRHLFDIGDDGQTTAYMPEDVLEYMYRYWKELGIWDGGTTTSDITDIKSSLYNPNGYPNPMTLGNVSQLSITDNYDNLFTYRSNIPCIAFKTSTNPNIIYTVAFSRTPFTIDRYNHDNFSTTLTGTAKTHNGETFYTYTLSGYTQYVITSPPINTLLSSSYESWDIAKIGLDGHITTTGGVDGAQPDPNATQPGTIDPSQPILPQLKQNMPNQFTNPIKEIVPQPDGTNKEIVYYPVPWPKITDDTDKPTTGESSQNDPTVTPESPDDETTPLKDVITNPLPQPETPTPGPPASPPDTGSGSTPTVVPPTGNASSLWAIYNPTQAQLDAFGSWLWSSDFVEQIKKLFNDPMQAIVGVHKVFATPSTSGQVNIKCGYIDSGCPAARVSSQYTTIDCGSVNVREYYGNVLDYSPYTEISLYLPFIGIVKLDTADVMRGSVRVKYHVDVITGACLADVIVNRDGENAVLYQYSGSAIVTYPISSGSYASMVTGVLSLAAGIAGTIMTGGAAAPALIGGAVGLSHLHTDVQKSGGFSGSPGAMGCKKPYLIISRAQDAIPADFEKYEGKPASKTVKIGNCDGFIRVKQINIDAVPATYGELDQIVTLLKQGVIL